MWKAKKSKRKIIISGNAKVIWYCGRMRNLLLLSHRSPAMHCFPLASLCFDRPIAIRSLICSLPLPQLLLLYSQCFAVIVAVYASASLCSCCSRWALTRLASVHKGLNTCRSPCTRDWAQSCRRGLLARSLCLASVTLAVSPAWMPRQPMLRPSFYSCLCCLIQLFGEDFL